MGAFESSVVSPVDRKCRRPPFGVEAAVAFRTAVGSTGDAFSGKEPNGGQKNDCGDRDDPPRHVVVCSKPVDLAGREEKGAKNCNQYQYSFHGTLQSAFHLPFFFSPFLMEMHPHP